MSTPFEQQMNADLGLIMADSLGPAVDMVLVDAQGEEKSLRGIFSPAGLDAFSATGAGIGSMTPGAPMTSTAPLLHIPQQAIQTALGRPLSTRDSFIIKGTTYKVQRPVDNGHGFVTVKLLKKD